MDTLYLVQQLYGVQLELVSFNNIYFFVNIKTPNHPYVTNCFIVNLFIFDENWKIKMFLYNFLSSFFFSVRIIIITKNEMILCISQNSKREIKWYRIHFDLRSNEPNKKQTNKKKTLQTTYRLTVISVWWTDEHKFSHRLFLSKTTHRH